MTPRLAPARRPWLLYGGTGVGTTLFVRDATGAPIARTAPAVVAERATDGTGMVLWGFLGAFALDLPPWTMMMFLALAAFGIAVLRSKRLSLTAESVLSKLPLVNRLAPHLRDFHGASSDQKSVVTAMAPAATLLRTRYRVNCILPDATFASSWDGPRCRVPSAGRSRGPARRIPRAA